MSEKGRIDCYRYGYQGQEKDDEIKGAGNSVNYTFRMHDPRLGRFFAVDPLSDEYPHYSPYSFSGNKTINMVELEGLEEAPVSYHYKPFNTLFVGQLGATKTLNGDGFLNGWGFFADASLNFSNKKNGIFTAGLHYSCDQGGSTFTATGVSTYGGNNSYRNYITSEHYSGESFNNVYINDFNNSRSVGMSLEITKTENETSTNAILHLGAKVGQSRGLVSATVSMDNLRNLSSEDGGATFLELNGSLSFTPNRNIGDRNFTLSGTYSPSGQSSASLDFSFGGGESMFNLSNPTFGTYGIDVVPNKDFKFNGWSFGGNIGGQMRMNFGEGNSLEFKTYMKFNTFANSLTPSGKYDNVGPTQTEAQGGGG